MSDQLKKFMFNQAPIRGEIVSLKQSWQEIRSRQPYPESVTNILGQMIAACSLLSVNLKFNSMMIMQIHATGPVNMLVVQCSSNLDIRAVAKIKDGVDIQSLDALSFSELLNPDHQAYCVITLDPAKKLPGQKPYQGIIPLFDGEKPIESIASMIEYYMHTSEQLETRIWLACNPHVAGGLLLQKLPEKGGTIKPNDQLDKDAWNRAVTISETITNEELLTLSPDELFKRLFWEEKITQFELISARFSCTCSREKVGNMLRLLGEKEVNHILEEQEVIHIHCDYCSQVYYFDPVDVTQLFTIDELKAGTKPADQQQH